jgi:hypothetical protein
MSTGHYGAGNAGLQHLTNDDAEIIEINNQGMIQAAWDVEQHRLKPATVRSYRAYIAQFIQWIKTSHGDIYEQSTQPVPGNIRNDPRFFYRPSDSVDLVYTGQNPLMLKGFLGSLKKADGSAYSFESLRKFRDAVVWGSSVRGQHLPTAWYMDVKQFLQGLKKKCASQKEAGEISDHASDPLKFTVYRDMCEWFLQDDDIESWAWTTWQWNMMARGDSIGRMHVGHFQPGDDSIRYMYSRSKADQDGENATWKNIYANNVNPSVCCFLSMACWLCVSNEQHRDTGFIFAHSKASRKAATSRKVAFYFNFIVQNRTPCVYCT